MIKDFKKTEDSDWSLLVNNALSVEEMEFVDKENKSDDELIALGNLYKKCETTPSESDVVMLDKIYNGFIKNKGLEDTEIKISGLHITLENGSIRGIFNYFIDKEFHQHSF
jgi:hypothetical protein